MVNMTLSMPDSVYKDMKQFPEIKWSEVARRAILEKIETLIEVERIAQKSKLTQKDVDEFTKKMKQKSSKRFRELS